jgi:hypothetical protein
MLIKIRELHCHLHQPWVKSGAGQNPAPITVSGAQLIPEGKIENGNVGFSVLRYAVANLTPQK